MGDIKKNKSNLLSINSIISLKNIQQLKIFNQVYLISKFSNTSKKSKMFSIKFCFSKKKKIQ